MTGQPSTHEREPPIASQRHQQERFDWFGLEVFMVSEIVATVLHLRREYPGQDLEAVAIADFYARDMLILWPTISVASRACFAQGTMSWRTQDWRWNFDSDRAGDEWAARLTAHAGSAGRRWNTTLQRFFDVVIDACRRAGEQLIAAEIVGPDFVVVPLDESMAMAQQSLSGEQLRRWFPDLHARRAEITELRATPVGQRISQLLGILTERRTSTLDMPEAQRMLADIGEPAALALVHLLPTIGNASEHDTEANMRARQRCFDVLDQIAPTTHEVLDELRDLLRNRQMPLWIRTKAASSLAWAGQLDTIADELATLPEELACAIAARPYLSATKRGPLDYRPVESVLALLPHLDLTLTQLISPRAMYEIDSADIGTAVHALSSIWMFVRRHAATVLLSTHL